MWSRSQSAACGAISASANSRTTSRNCTCSGLRSKSTVRPYPRPRTVARVRVPLGSVPLRSCATCPRRAAARSCATAHHRSSACDPTRRAHRAAASRRVRRVARDRRAAASGSASARTTSAARSSACTPAPPTTSRLPDVAFARYDTRLVIHDDGELELIGDAARPRSARSGAARGRGADASTPAAALDAWTSSLDRVDHAAACAQVLRAARARASATR